MRKLILTFLMFVALGVTVTSSSAGPESSKEVMGATKHCTLFMEHLDELGNGVGLRCRTCQYMIYGAPIGNSFEECQSAN